jgi:deoxycytidylate deaminase
MLINAGINSLILAEDYPDDLAKKIFSEAGVTVDCLS